MGKEIDGQPVVAARMSNRLITIAEMLKGDDQVGTVADVGCDHGYISIYLVQSGIAQKAIAMDVRKGPLSGALSNIKDYSLEDKITVRLSDGLKKLTKDEADALVIAGMGGKLMMRLVEDADIQDLGIKLGVLQPQSELSEFRQYLRDKGYSILDEKMVLEDGKYYFPMKVIFTEKSDVELKKAVADLMGKTGCDEKMAVRLCNRFGEANILRKDPILKSYLEHGIEVNLSILKSLDKASHPERYDQVALENEDNKKLLFYITQ